MVKKIKFKIHLKAKIMEAGYTLDQLAKEIGITPSSLSKICNQHYDDIHGSTMLKIAKKINIRPDDIWEPLDE
ncbi:helix-turn-helix domain-containing protein [Desulforamulus reducens]|uniref:helix-turn-helix domain-containing protein n=1 Tax=Desulforamulus reducens TaxID=59610 RepID=UPI0003117A21